MIGQNFTFWHCLVVRSYAYITRHGVSHRTQSKLLGYLGFMFVKPEFRGRGINNLLLNDLKKWVLSKGITEVRLEVYSDNDPAVRAYEKAGFKQILTTMRCDIS
ncbi:GNAT family N-acetyltransferase [Flavobacterium sp. LBUM151]